MKYKNYNVELEFGRYDNFGNVSITLVNADPTDIDHYIAVATVNVEPLDDGEVSIKDYSENEGMLQWLMDNNIVDPPHRYIQSGWVEIPVCKLIKEVI